MTCVKDLLFSPDRLLKIDIPEQDYGELATLGGAIKYLAARASR